MKNTQFFSSFLIITSSSSRHQLKSINEIFKQSRQVNEIVEMKGEPIELYEWKTNKTVNKLKQVIPVNWILCICNSTSSPFPRFWRPTPARSFSAISSTSNVIMQFTMLSTSSSLTIHNVMGCCCWWCGWCWNKHHHILLKILKI